MMVRVLGTKVRGSVVFVTFFLYLVPSRSQMGLFLAETHFVSDFFAPLSCPGPRFFAVSAVIYRGITMSPALVSISGL